MTVNITNAWQAYTGDDTDTPRTWNRPIFEANDLSIISVVTATGVVTPLTNGFHYTVTVAADNQSATITPAAAIGSTLTWVAYRTGDFLQTLDQSASLVFNAEGVENTLDKIVLELQELKRDVDRSLKFPLQDEALGATIDPELGDKASRLDLLLKFDSVTGDPQLVDVADISANVVTMSAQGIRIVEDTTPAQVRTEIDAQQDIIDTEGQIIIGNGSGVASTLAIGASGTVLTSNGTTATWAGSVQSYPWPDYYITGFKQNTTGTAYQIAVGVGSARFHGAGLNESNATGAATVINVNTAWDGVGDGANTGITYVADTWYRLFALHKTSDGSVTYAVDTDANDDAAGALAFSAIATAGYDDYRQIGWFRTNSTPNDIIQYYYNPASAWYELIDPIFSQSFGAFSDTTHATQTVTWDCPFGDTRVKAIFEFYDGAVLAAPPYGHEYRIGMWHPNAKGNGEGTLPTAFKHGNLGTTSGINEHTYTLAWGATTTVNAMLGGVMMVTCDSSKQNDWLLDYDIGADVGTITHCVLSIGGFEYSRQAQ